MKPSWEFSSIKKLQVLAPSAKALANRKPEGQMELPMRYVGLGELNFCRCHLKIRRGVIPGFPCRVSYRLCLKRIRRIIHSAHMYIFSIFIMYIYIYVYSIQYVIYVHYILRTDLGHHGIRFQLLTFFGMQTLHLAATKQAQKQHLPKPAEPLAVWVQRLGKYLLCCTHAGAKKNAT